MRSFHPLCARKLVMYKNSFIIHKNFFVGYRIASIFYVISSVGYSISIIILYIVLSTTSKGFLCVSHHTGQKSHLSDIILQNQEKRKSNLCIIPQIIQIHLFYFWRQFFILLAITNQLLVKEIANKLGVIDENTHIYVHIFIKYKFKYVGYLYMGNDNFSFSILQTSHSL